MTTLDEWEAEAKGELQANEASFARWSDLDFRKYKLKKILSLIELVRKKDDILIKIRMITMITGKQNQDKMVEIIDRTAEEALELTEKIK